MLRECKEFRIPVEVNPDRVAEAGGLYLNVVPGSAKDRMFYDTEAESGISSYHLQEGCSYEYEFVEIGGKTYQFAEISDVVRYSRLQNRKGQGFIRTGNYVGQLCLPVVELETGSPVGKVVLEIRSVKADYESDYRQMLDEIAQYYTDLVLQQGSPVRQMLEVDDTCSSQTLYQRFSFVRSLVDSDSFHEAIHKIEVSPVRKWTETTVKRDVSAVRRLGRKNLKQMASSADRVDLPLSYRNGFLSGLESVPRTLEIDYKRDTVDNLENRFVKFVLRSFLQFCSELGSKKNAGERLKREVSETVNHLSSFLDSQFFRQVSMPTHLNLNSPVLQRKEGYREVLQAWLLFDLSARLSWKGGDNVYEAGKKNVAALYEYWLFFKLQELVGEFFSLNPADKARLVKTDDDGIGLDLIQGRTVILRGVSQTEIRCLNVAFYYNRTFSSVRGGVGDNISGLDLRGPATRSLGTAGSWTVSMRPDYTLSIWPGNISEPDAEAQELITHIHFDAKYRLDNFLMEDAFDENPAQDGLLELDYGSGQVKIVQDKFAQEKDAQALGVYKRADLLKMHAYKDAIRRTSGAYVLYPGTETRRLQGFHEVVPGLGAFSLRPGHWTEDSVPLRDFLQDVKWNMLNRTSDREKMSFYAFDTYSSDASGRRRVPLCERLPENAGANRSFMPDRTWVLLFNCKANGSGDMASALFDWIGRNHTVAVALGALGSSAIDPSFVNARYLLLHDGQKSLRLVRIADGGPQVCTRSQLLDVGYPLVGGLGCRSQVCTTLGQLLEEGNSLVGGLRGGVDGASDIGEPVGANVDMSMEEASGLDARIGVMTDLFLVYKTEALNDYEQDFSWQDWNVARILQGRPSAEVCAVRISEVVGGEEE